MEDNITEWDGFFEHVAELAKDVELSLYFKDVSIMAASTGISARSAQLLQQASSMVPESALDSGLRTTGLWGVQAQLEKSGVIKYAANWGKVGLGLSVMLGAYDVWAAKPENKAKVATYEALELSGAILSAAVLTAAVIAIAPAALGSAAIVAIAAGSALIGTAIASFVFREDGVAENLFDSLGSHLADLFSMWDPMGIESEVNSLFEGAQTYTPPRRRDPLVLDLDGDGIEITSADGTVFFDHANDGVEEDTAWVSSDDGFLVFDRNANGVVDGGAELFGDNTLLSDGGLAESGFAALADLDTNNDGRVDGGDESFQQLQIWRDLNGDGVSQSDELFSLGEMGIEALYTSHSASGANLGGGSVEISAGEFLRSDGSLGKMSDLGLGFESFRRKFSEAVPIPDEIASLPDMMGSGAVRDLLQAASLRNELAGVLASYASAQTKEEQEGLLNTLLLEWARSADFNFLEARIGEWNAANPGAEINYLDGSEGELSLMQKLQVLEVFNGTEFGPVQGVFSSDGSSRLLAAQNDMLLAAYEELRGSVYSGLLMQTRLAGYANSIGVLSDGGVIALDFSGLEEFVGDQLLSDPVNTVADLLELKTVSNVLNNADWDFYDFLGRSLRPLITDNPEIETLLNQNNIGLLKLGVLDGATEGYGVFIGNDESNSITGTAGAETVFGGNGNDTLISWDGNDLLDGGAGDDLLVARNGSSHLIGGEGDDILRIDRGGRSTSRYYANTFEGGKGNDRLEGHGGADTYLFNRGDGQDVINDYQYGDYGVSDRIVFGAEISRDQVTVTREGNNIVLLVADPAGVENDRITLEHAFTDGNYKIEQVVFADGTVLSATDLQDLAEIVQGTEGDDELQGTVVRDELFGNGGNDTLISWDGNDLLDGGAGDDLLVARNGSSHLIGGEGDDTLRIDRGGRSTSRYYANTFEGGKGNDRLEGHGGADTYLFSRGDGQDVINDYEYGSYGKVDRVQFSDVTSDELWFTRDGGDLLMSTVGADDHVRIENWYSDSRNQIEEIITPDAVLVKAQVNQLVDAMAAFSVPAGSSPELTPAIKEELSVTMAASWTPIA